MCDVNNAAVDILGHRSLSDSSFFSLKIYSYQWNPEIKGINIFKRNFNTQPTRAFP